jgi:hypothetical protein
MDGAVVRTTTCAIQTADPGRPCGFSGSYGSYGSYGRRDRYRASRGGARRARRRGNASRLRHWP